MNTRARFVTLVVSVLLVGSLNVTTGAGAASATTTTLCRGYAACAKAGMGNAGYATANTTMYWRMYSGHNCTNYAAFRVVRSGLPNIRPWSGGGNATNWGSAMATITNSTPAVGAVAWWKAYVSPAGSAGHVAYVEQVVSPSEIIVSQDSWGGDFSWARITRTSKGWPSGFIHFNDVPLLNTATPTVKGVAKVGSVLTASAGVWSQADATIAYQWQANGSAIAGATGSTLALALAQQGKAISVRVTASKLGYPTRSVVSTATAAVQPGVISSVVAPTVTGQPSVDATLTADPGSWTPAPDKVSYQWTADGTPLPGATTPSLRLDQSSVGRTVAVIVTAAKSGYAPVHATSAPMARVSPGSLALTRPPSVSGVAQLGRTLTLTTALSVPEAAASVQWLRAGVPVTGATGPTYRLTAADLGSRISARVGLTRDGYTPLTARTVSTAPVKSQPTIRVTTLSGRARLTVTATVTAPGVRPVPGVIQVRWRGRVLKQVPLRNGVAKATVTGLPRGLRTFRFRFPTTAEVASGMVERRTTIL